MHELVACYRNLRHSLVIFTLVPNRQTVLNQKSKFIVKISKK